MTEITQFIVKVNLEGQVVQLERVLASSGTLGVDLPKKTLIKKVEALVGSWGGDFFSETDGYVMLVLIEMRTKDTVFKNERLHKVPPWLKIAFTSHTKNLPDDRHTK